MAQQNEKAFPELMANLSHVEKVLKKEEERFIKTLDLGMGILETSN